MRHVVSAAVLGTFALLAAAPAWAAGGAGDAADPRFAAAPQATPASAAVDPRLQWNATLPAADAWLVAGPCEPPCAPPPCAPPAPCGVCRKGYDSCGNAKWGFAIMLGGWLPGVTGTVGARGLEADADMTPSDALDHLDDLDFTILGSVRATYGRWNFCAGLYYMGLGTEANVTDQFALDVEYYQWIVEGAVGYRVAEVSLGCEPCAPCMAVQPFVGLRYNSLDLTITDRSVSTNLQTRNANKSWVDLIVGAELLFDFRNQWWVRLEGDIGGFGISADTDMTWGLRGEVGYDFNEHVGVFLGLGAIDWDYQDGGFTWNVTQWGPYLGVVFSF